MEELKRWSREEREKRGEITPAQRIAWDYLDGAELYGGNTLRDWAVGVVEAVQEWISEGNSPYSLPEVAEGAVPIGTCEKLALIGDSAALASIEPVLNVERNTPEGVCDAVIHDIAIEIVDTAYEELYGEQD
jgi:hypothetical protein